MQTATDNLKTALADRYRIGRELGGGGMSRVFQESETDLDLPLALPAFDVVRSNPRFAAVLRRFNLDVERLTSPDGGRSR